MSSLKQLEQLVREDRVAESDRLRRNAQIASHVFATSPYLSAANFTKLHPDDLLLLYELYDENYFRGLLGKSLDPRKLSFRLSRRMTTAGGKTTHWLSRNRDSDGRFEIAVSTTLMFQSFQDPEEKVTVTGLDCESRLDGLMRVMEHEFIHLIEMMVWADSSCSQHRFQDIASRLFGHTDHRHELMTPREVARKQFGIRTGSKVRFDYDGCCLEGVVNRITKRATVLVVHPSGKPYSDGHRYVKYYVPVKNLEPID